MGVNMKKMRRGYESQQRGGDFWNVPEGDSLVYVHPPCREEDEYEPTEGLNYIPVAVHYAVGKNNAMCVCLDSDNNPIIKHPFIKALLKKRGIKLDGNCPVCEAIQAGKMDADDGDRSRVQTRYLWGLTLLKHRGKSSQPWNKVAAKPAVAFVGKTVYDGLMEMFFDNGDITEMGAAILAKINRVGTGPTDTKYKVAADTESLKKPKKLAKRLRDMVLKALKEGGDCDLFRIVSQLIKSPEEVEAAMAGVKVELDEDDDDEDDIEDEEDTTEDDGAEEDEEEDAEDDDDEDDEEDDEDDDDEDDEEDDEDDDEEDDEDDDEDEEDDEDGDDGEEDEEDAEEDDGDDDEEDDDELELDELDKELDRIHKGKKKTPAKEKKKKPAKKSPAKKKSKKK